MDIQEVDALFLPDTSPELIIKYLDFVYGFETPDQNCFVDEEYLLLSLLDPNCSIMDDDIKIKLEDDEDDDEDELPKMRHSILDANGNVGDSPQKVVSSSSPFQEPKSGTVARRCKVCIKQVN